MDGEYILQMKNISKTFPGVKALDNVKFNVRKGTVHALMGENGAGKSTLMKVLIGIHKADSGGTILFDGQPIVTQDIKSIMSLGISMIHQELSPIPEMTVAENIYLGREPIKKGSIFLDKKRMVQDTQTLFESLAVLNINPRSKMKELSVAKTQMVEIAKAISYNSKLIIMDEPTSAITECEVEQLFKIVNELKAEGVSFVFITHKMDEVFQITDEVTVLRDGQFVGTVPAASITKNGLIEMMVGREITHMFPKEEAEIGDVILSVRNFKREGFFNDISFDLRRGEILGISGLMGSGRTEVVESLFGYQNLDGGEVFIHGQPVTINSPRDAVQHKMALLTEDRKQTGLLNSLSVRDNIIVTSIGNYINGLLIDKKRIEEDCLLQKTKLSIKTPHLDQGIENLSGGNQQKVLIARWLLTEPDIFIIDEPTRGIDVGAKAEIHRLLSRLANEGKAIIMISSELPEILGISDRVLVMHEGNITGELLRDEADQTKIMEFATGTKNMHC